MKPGEAVLASDRPKCRKECIIMTEKKTGITESTVVETEKKTKKAGRPRKPAAEKRTAARKSTTAKAEPKMMHPEVFLQLNDREDIQTRDIVAAVKKDWCEKNGREEKDIESLQVYVKPFEYAAYYVVNGDVDGTGKVEL